jgi:hypothetical protein
MSNIIPVDTSLEDKIKEELLNLFESKRKRIFSKIMSAALGSVPWVGGFLSAMNDFRSDESHGSWNLGVSTYTPLATCLNFHTLNTIYVAQRDTCLQIMFVSCGY